MEFPILLETVCLLLKMGGLTTKISGKGLGAGFADNYYFESTHKRFPWGEDNISVFYSLFQK